MVLKDYFFDDNFFKEEIRGDYVVTESKKKIWAIQLDLLRELQRVCKKYNLEYFADSGTLIGAIRHEGFIPWDDDMDIVMRRADYNILCGVASSEFTEPIFLQNTYSDIGYARAHAQLRNSESTCYIPKDVGCEYNKGIFIDIFPMDNIPDSKISYSLFLAGLKIRWFFIGVSKEHFKKHKKLIVRIASRVMAFYYKYHDIKKSMMRYERYCSRYNKKDTKRISYIAYGRGKKHLIFENNWYRDRVEKKFEMLTIMCPLGYDERLHSEYGDYMTPRRVGGHSNIVFDPDRSYKEVFDEKGFIK